MTYKPLPAGLTIRRSPINGLGLFSEKGIERGISLGMTHVADDRFEDGYIRLPLGGFFNHSKSPNCEIVSDDEYLYLKTIKNISAGDELTATYTLYSPGDSND